MVGMTDEIEEAWAILAVAVLYKRQVTPEGAASLYAGQTYQSIQSQETSATIDEILAMRQDGMTFKQIGKELGIDGTAAWKRLKSAGHIA